MRRILLVTFLLFFCFGSSMAQSVYVGGLFPTIDHSGKLTNKLDYNLYYFGAFPLVNFNTSTSSDNARFLLFYSEQALTYNLNQQFSLTASYVYQRENSSPNNYWDENRLYAQATFKHTINRMNIKHRLRFDNRFIKNETLGKMPYMHRLRYLVGMDRALAGGKNKLYLTAYEEVFLNTFSNAMAVYGENWAYAAIGFKLGKQNKIELGPLFITWITSKNTWFNQFYGQVTWVSSLDFTKSK